VGLGLTLLFVAVFIVVKIKKELIPGAGCGGCSYSTGTCGPGSKQSCKKPDEPGEQKVTLEKLEK